MKAIRTINFSTAQVVFFFLIVCVLITIQQGVILDGPTVDGIKYPTKYNNYLIFKTAFQNLREELPLYQHYPEIHFDRFLYSPTFALLFGLFSWLPDPVGLGLWNALNIGVLTYVLWFFPGLSHKKKQWLLAFVLLELFTATQNSQSNAFITGAIVLAYILLEDKKYFWATFFICLTIYIKLFGLVAFVLFLFYPQKWKFVLLCALWMLVLAVLPLLVVPFSFLKEQYIAWYGITTEGHANLLGFSVYGWLASWFSFTPNKLSVMAVGVILFCLPLCRIKVYSNTTFKVLYLASILIWVVIFNHRAESPSFILAITGVGLWYYIQEPKVENLVLLLFAFVFTSLGSTDLFPASVRANFLRPWQMKAFGCILVWGKVVYDQLTIKATKMPDAAASE